MTTRNTSNAALKDLGGGGAEERFTVCDPQTSFFVQCCQRHTNFAFAQLDYVFDQNPTNLPTWNDGLILECKQTKHGDLAIGSWLQLNLSRLTLPSGTIARADDAGGTLSPFLLGERDEDVNLHWVEEVGPAAVMQADWVVGANTMDRLYPETIHMYHEHGTPEGRILRDAIGKQRSGNYINSSYTNTPALQSFSATDRALYVPLYFSYMQSPKNAFPIVAVTHDPIRYRITLRGRSSLIVALDMSTPGTPVPISKADPLLNPTTAVTGGILQSAYLTMELVFLAKPEQASYTSTAFKKYYEYTQVKAGKMVRAGDKTVTIDNLGFNHRVVQLSAFYRATAKLADNVGEYFNFSTPLPVREQPGSIRPTLVPSTVVGVQRELNPFENIEVRYGSDPRVSRQGVYWHEVVPHMRHRRIDDSFSCVYSWATEPECGSCPTGAATLGRWPQTPMVFTFIDSAEVGGGIAGDGEIRVYGRTQNFYKIVGGRLALLWSAV